MTAPVPGCRRVATWSPPEAHPRDVSVILPLWELRQTTAEAALVVREWPRRSWLQELRARANDPAWLAKERRRIAEKIRAFDATPQGQALAELHEEEKRLGLD